MPFDATLPAANSQISSTELRNQFNGLKTLVDLKATVTGPALNPPGHLDFFDSVEKNVAMLMGHRKHSTLRDHYSIATTSCGAN